MRSRRDDVDHAAAVERALRLGLVGMGEATDERAERRLDRFIAAPDGAFVWTRDGDGAAYLGRITGPWRRDEDGAAVDLVNVRDCDWVVEPVDPGLIPAAVAQTFARGGRNFQQTHPGDVEAQTQTLWLRLAS
ncbi:GAF domain-containing protein [Aeromicrobium wangtongii]|uniref:GAF domain-containing protein n=1 Tax=Aeromicrobium wangtongii TaxID=2969247 RepID=UPI002017DA28|nr:GAF domain-containing protein [Aeromicrobium wangtongii]MCL3818091.1 GAF domain-containing protein [Aeromicrobium wangtongii]